MESQYYQALIISTALVVLSLAFLWLNGRDAAAHLPPSSPAPSVAPTDEVLKLIARLKAALPNGIVRSPADAQEVTTKGHWAQQECERVPACVVQPRDSSHVSTAVTILAAEHERQHSSPSTGIESLFAVRGGGHSPVDGAASTQGGVLIDLSQLNQIVVAQDQTTVSIGAGCRWGEVYTQLRKDGLATAGGRNSHVGVSGLTLGGGISFFSPRYGFVCSNVVEYEIVLASGEFTTASEHKNADLWQALKGGANNFGIVTRFTARCFPCEDIWSGILYMPVGNPAKILDALKESIDRSDPSGPAFDRYAAGPILSFTYVQGLPFWVAAAILAYTDTPKGSSWPNYWRSSSFSSLWRFWSTCRVRSLTSSTDELNQLNLPGKRQSMTSTTIKNDRRTMQAAFDVCAASIVDVKHVKGLIWTMVYQPLVPEWARKGDPNSLGLDEGEDGALVLVQFTVNWTDSKYDSLISSKTREALEAIEQFASAAGTLHRYRYLNYCDSWQDPFGSYGEHNREFLRIVSKKYDSQGLFQTGCKGGCKLWDRDKSTMAN